MVYNINMIKSFKHKGLEKFYKTGSIKGVQFIHTKKLRQILFMLNAMTTIDDLNIPPLRLHKLKGSLKDLWSVTVQANWRITFEFDESTNDVYIVDYLDYH